MYNSRIVSGCHRWFDDEIQTAALIDRKKATKAKAGGRPYSADFLAVKARS